MISRYEENPGRKSIIIHQQERDGYYQFSGYFIATRSAIDKFGEETIKVCHILLQEQVKEKGGLDYLQVFEIDGQKLWFIDDVTHVTCLLPSDY